MAEKRKHDPKNPNPKGSPLPSDFTKMVEGVLTNGFKEGLEILNQVKSGTVFKVGGNIYPDEIIMTVGLVSGGSITATSIHASCDFDPKASSPKAEDILGTLIDAVGALFAELLDPNEPEKIKEIASSSLASFEGVPYKWTPFEIEKRTVHLKVDKMNPDLEGQADELLEEDE